MTLYRVMNSFFYIFRFPWQYDNDYITKIMLLLWLQTCQYGQFLMQIWISRVFDDIRRLNSRKVESNGKARRSIQLMFAAVTRYLHAERLSRCDR